MMNLLVVSRRLPGMTRREYLRHFQNIHGTKILAGPPDMLQDLAGYVQNHVVDAAYGTHGAPMAAPVEMDSVSEIYFPNPEAVGHMTTHPYYLSVIQPDEHLFADGSTLQLMMVVEEQEAVAVPRRGAVKLMHFIATPAGVAHDSLFEPWRIASRSIIEDEVLKPALCRYVRSHALPTPRDATGELLGGAPVNQYAGAASLWFDRDDDLSGIDRYRKRFEEIFPSNSGMVDSARSMFLIVQELALHPR